MAKVATMLMIIFGDISGKKHMVATSVVVPRLLGTFGIIRIMTNLKFIVDEMNDKMAKTAYGQNKIRSNFSAKTSICRYKCDCRYLSTYGYLLIFNRMRVVEAYLGSLLLFSIIDTLIN